jgi:hypothetical protein
MTLLERSHSSRPNHHTAEAAFRLATHNPFEKEVAARAVAFTTICFLGRGKYDRRDYGTFEEALAGAPAHRAACGKGVLVYAICDRGYTALVATLPRPNNSHHRGQQ